MTYITRSYNEAILELACDNYLSPSHVESLMEMGLRAEGLYKERAKLSYSRLMTIWDLHAEEFLSPWDGAA